MRALDVRIDLNSIAHRHRGSHGAADLIDQLGILWREESPLAVVAVGSSIEFRPSKPRLDVSLSRVFMNTEPGPTHIGGGLAVVWKSGRIKQIPTLIEKLPSIGLGQVCAPERHAAVPFQLSHLGASDRRVLASR